MATLLQIDFPFSGPWGADMTTALDGMAQDIAQEDGLIWKIWTENSETQRAGGIYLFETPTAAQAYATKHSARLGAFGIKEISVQSFAVNDALSAITHFKAQA